MIAHRRAGAVAAFGAAATFVVGFALYFQLLMPAEYGRLSVDPARHVAFLIEHRQVLYAWYFTIYVVFGLLLVVLNQLLARRLRPASPELADLAFALGLIWSTLVIASGMVANIGSASVIALHPIDPGQAASLWRSLQVVINGLGGGNEIVGGAWVLTLSWAGLRSKRLPSALNYLGLLCGVAGVLTAIPALTDLGAIFGFGLIVWFIGLGVVFLRRTGSLVRDEAEPITAAGGTPDV